MQAEALQSARFLIVDDEVANVYLLERILEKAEYTNVRSTTDPRQALPVCEEFLPDLVLLDLHMPDPDGFAVIEQLTSRLSVDTLPSILVLTADITPEAKHRSLAAGAADYLAKPFDAIEVLLRIKNLLTARFLRRQLQDRNQLLAGKLKELGALTGQLERRSADLQTMYAELEAFSYSVSHDLRAPLRAMRGFAQALQDDYGHRLDPTGQDYARRIVAAAQRMDALIQDLLDYSRLSRAELGLEPVALGAVVTEGLAHLEAELRATGAQVTAADQLPTVMAHRATLVQIVTNLLTNAMKFVSPGVTPQVRVWAESREDWVRLWVADNGIGISPQDHQRIFDIFERLHGVDTYPGTGMGLAIIRRGVERLGGRVGLESAVGDGSRFWVELRAPGVSQ